MNTTAIDSETSVITQTQIEVWIANYIAQLCKIKREKISHSTPLSNYGLDSATAVQLSGDLMDWLNCDIDPSLLFEYPTIEMAAAHILILLGNTK